MNESEDPYEILGVSSDASEQEIKKAYRKLALKHHPDKQITDEEREEAQTIFSKIANAYQILSDEPSKKQYDLRKKLGKQKANVASTTPANGSSSHPTYTYYYEEKPKHREQPSVASSTSSTSSSSTSSQPTYTYYNQEQPAPHPRQKQTAFSSHSTQIHHDPTTARVYRTASRMPSPQHYHDAQTTTTDGEPRVYSYSYSSTDGSIPSDLLDQFKSMRGSDHSSSSVHSDGPRQRRRAHAPSNSGTTIHYSSTSTTPKATFAKTAPNTQQPQTHVQNERAKPTTEPSPIHHYHHQPQVHHHQQQPPLHAMYHQQGQQQPPKRPLTTSKSTVSYRCPPHMQRNHHHHQAIGHQSQQDYQNLPYPQQHKQYQHQSQYPQQQYHQHPPQQQELQSHCHHQHQQPPKRTMVAQKQTVPQLHQATSTRTRTICHPDGTIETITETTVTKANGAIETRRESKRTAMPPQQHHHQQRTMSTAQAPARTSRSGTSKMSTLPTQPKSAVRRASTKTPYIT